MDVKEKSLGELLTILESAFGDVLSFSWDNFPDASDDDWQKECEDRLSDNEKEHKAAIAEIRLRIEALMSGRK